MNFTRKTPAKAHDAVKPPTLSGAAKVLSPEERAAFLRSRPDLKPAPEA